MNMQIYKFFLKLSTKMGCFLKGNQKWLPVINLHFPNASYLHKLPSASAFF